MISRLLFRIGTFFIGAAIVLKVLAIILAIALIIIAFLVS